MKTVNRDELRTRMQASPGRVTLIDVRDRPDYESEHIKGAISIPLSELAIRAEKTFNRDQEIIVYCGSFSCPASTKAAELLEQKGFKNVIDYKGGLEDWKIAGFLTEVGGRARAA